MILGHRLDLAVSRTMHVLCVNFCHTAPAHQVSFSESVIIFPLFFFFLIVSYLSSVVVVVVVVVVVFCFYLVMHEKVHSHFFFSFSFL